MSIAFPALVITLLILPGVLFYYTYRKGIWQSPVILGPFQSEFSKGVLFAIPINIFGICLAGLLSQKPIDFEAALVILTGWQGVDEGGTARYMTSVSSSPRTILSYVLTINVFGALLGTGVHCWVRRNVLDLKYNLFRFPNEWYYLFSGEALYFDDGAHQLGYRLIKQVTRNIDFVFVTVSIEQGGGVYLYRGVLSSYYFDKSGELDKIVLERPQWKLIFADSKSSSGEDNAGNNRFRLIMGDFLIVDYSHVRNLSIQYLNLAAAPEPTYSTNEEDPEPVTDSQDSTQKIRDGIGRVLNYKKEAD